MNNIIKYASIIIPTLGMLSGLSLAITTTTFSLAMVLYSRNRINITLLKHRSEILFLFLLLISTSWSSKPFEASIMAISLILLISPFYLTFYNIDTLSTKIKFTYKYLTWGFIGALFMFYFEYFTSGVINSSFRFIFQANSSTYHFMLYNLDRGCVMLSLLAWVVMACNFLESKKYLSFIIYSFTIITLYISDSLAAFVGFLLGGMLFMLLSFCILLNPRILSGLVICSSLLFLSIIKNYDAKQIIDKFDSIPISAKHRIFIWKHTMELSETKPLLGHGFGESRFIDSQKDYTMYNNIKLLLFPTHPHNNLMQLLLENGIIGLMFYLTLICGYIFRWHSLFKDMINDHNKKYRTVYKTGISCLACLFVISMISFNIWQPWFICTYLWVGVYMSSIYSNLHKEYITVN